MSADDAAVARRILRGGKFTLADLGRLSDAMADTNYAPLAFAVPVVRDLARAADRQGFWGR